MLDIRLIREQPELVRAALANRGEETGIDALLTLDEQRRALTAARRQAAVDNAQPASETLEGGSGEQGGIANTSAAAEPEVEQNPADEEECWEQILRRLENAGFAVDPVEPGCAYFEIKGIERLDGGFQETLCRALDTVGLLWEPRLGVASRRFTALAAASVASSGKALVVDDDEAELLLEPLPFDLLPLPLGRRMELSAFGVDMSGSNAIEA